ncbi:hypothetical protein BST63_27335 [Bradyrhizobium canariense]|uniref:DUF3800 domain-containing protein n=1 Tax=Bradyrhizobium canariense TaxID=255045 RepID=A0ABX3WX32_9BRAD|nr:DUF3800 domain-containing protein [Bradyrhizobium canariense]OSJ08862.1 hypothetical protein BSR47_35705 [Bradyrhizobium canariense]OSJ24255.1 hypothetical protein BST63_27335 [Bradyrhizobium canariense]
MHFFIDEGGTFTATAGWSAVCSLALPHKEVGPARREIDFISRKWPRRDGELKGGSLSADHLKALVEVLFRHDAILHVCAIDMAQENPDDIERHKAGQCEGITNYLAPSHHPNFVAEVQGLRKALERIPAQLYVQCVLMSELIETAIEENLMYFAQRRPRELGRFEWTIDAKDPVRISPQEAWWRDTLGPLQESKTRDKPMRFVRDPAFDYRYFNKNFMFEKELWHPDKPRELIQGYDVRKVISGQISFVDSRSETLIQAVDILTSFMRRWLANEISDDDVTRSLGRLQILKNNGGKPQSLQLATLSRKTGMRKSKLKANSMALAGRVMMKPGRGKKAA